MASSSATRTPTKCYMNKETSASQPGNLQTELPQLNVNNYLYKSLHFFIYWLDEVTINMKKGITLILSSLYVPSSVGFSFVRCFCSGRYSWKARTAQTSGRWIDTPPKIRPLSSDCLNCGSLHVLAGWRLLDSMLCPWWYPVEQTNKAVKVWVSEHSVWNLISLLIC